MLGIQRGIKLPSPDVYKSLLAQDFPRRLLIVGEPMIPALTEMFIEMFHAGYTPSVPASLPAGTKIGCIVARSVIAYGPLGFRHAETYPSSWLEDTQTLNKQFSDRARIIEMLETVLRKYHLAAVFLEWQ